MSESWTRIDKNSKIASVLVGYFNYSISQSDLSDFLQSKKILACGKFSFNGLVISMDLGTNFANNKLPTIFC